MHRDRVLSGALLAVALLCAPATAQTPRSAEAPALAALAGHWEGKAVHRGRTFRLALDVAVRGSETVARVDYLDLPLYAIPFAVSVEGTTVRIERRPAGGPVTTFAGELRNNRIAGTFTGAGAKDADFALERTSATPRLLREETVEFRNGPVKLVGTLILPDGRGPFPAVVITHGGAPEHRDSAGYRGEGVLFARAGVAALVYDKRGVGESTGGDWTVSSIEDFAGDALAGLRAIAGRAEIDPKRIGVAGHSQGGWIGPLAATMTREVAFVVATSPSGINPMEQSIFHTSNMLRRAGYSEEVVARAASLRDRWYERARKGAYDDRLPSDLEAASREPWFEIAALPHPVSPELAEGMRRLLLFEPAPVWERVKVPVLAVWGSEDIVLPAARSREIVEAALERGGNRDRRLHMLPNGDHNLYLVRAPSAEWDFPRRAGDYERILSEWLRERVVRA